MKILSIIVLAVAMAFNMSLLHAQGKIDPIKVGVNPGGGMSLNMTFSDMDGANQDTSTNFVDVTPANNVTWYWNAQPMDSEYVATTDTFTVWVMGYFSEQSTPVRIDTITINPGANPSLSGTLSISKEFKYWGLQAKRNATGDKLDETNMVLYIELWTKKFNTDEVFQYYMKLLDKYYDKEKFLP